MRVDEKSEAQKLQRDAIALARNVPDGGGALVFRNNKSAEQQLRRIIGRCWVLQGCHGGSTLNRHSKWLFQFATVHWAMLGSYHPDDWQAYRADVRDVANDIALVCARLLQRQGAAR